MKDHVAILVRDNNKFLFIKRSEHKKTLPNIWAFPSGTKEDNEEVCETAEREAYEELGIKVKVENTLAIRELPELVTRLHFIICSILSGTPFIKELNEISEIEWLTLSQFFDKYDDSRIGHGLIFLRQNPQIWGNYI
jgi:8-oxo-dGTP pyrophosphatase MutT (NUDIX family)